MQRFLLLTAALLSFSSAWAFKGFTCANYGADSVFRLSQKENEKTKEKETIIEWDLKRGLKSLPLYEGVVSIDDLPMIQHQIQDLKVLDVNYVRFVHKFENCEFESDSEKQVNCNGKAEFQEPKNQHVQSYTLMTSWIEEKLLGWSYRAFKVRVGLDTPDMHYLITFVFDPKKCTFY